MDQVHPSCFTLNNGIQMPSIGLGTFRIRNGQDIMKTLDYALKTGYRMLDTAAVYGNEGFIKNALQVLLPKYGLTRENIFITTKLSPSDHGGGETTYNACKRSLDNLGLEYVDLYLIHFPGASKIASEDTRNKSMRDSTWAIMTRLYDDGLVKAIGVSNYTVRHLKELMSNNHGVIPVVNQIEWHPYYHQKELYNYCKENKIVLQAYCSLGGTSVSQNNLLKEPIVKKIAMSHGATCAQVLLVWALQQGVAIIPKSTNPERIQENISLNFKLSNEELRGLDDLGKQNVKYAWDPNIVA